MDLLVVRLSSDVGELAADLLRQAGAWAVEERTVPLEAAWMTELRIAVGAKPDPTLDEALARIRELDPTAQWHREVVDESVLSSWRDHSAAHEITDGWTVVPAWNNDVMRSVEPSRRIEIDPGTVFGMGDHPTTLGMMRAIHDSCRSGGGSIRRMVDAGCGSGILAVFAARVHGIESRCFDIAPESPSVVRINAARNGVEGLVTVVDGDSGIDRGWADLVVANIGAGTLIELQPAIERMCAPGASVILGGIRKPQVDTVVAAYGDLDVECTATVDGWSTVTLRCSGSDRATRGAETTRENAVS